MALLPGWPLIEHAVSFLNGPTTAPNPLYWVNVTSRTLDRASVKRGRQYELDQVQTGEASLSLYNTDGAFDPGNAASPFYPLVLPYRGYRMRAQYPVTANILTASQATAGLTTYDGFGGSSSLPAGVLPTWATGTYGFTTTGTGNYTNAVPSSPTAGTYLQVMQGFSFTPGSTMSASVNVASTASVTLQVIWRGTKPDGSQFSSGGSSSPTVVTTAQTLTSSYAPPANTIGLEAVLYLNSGSAACTVTATQWQVQTGASTGYATPGVWYPIYNGFVERWNQMWTRGGTYGVSNLDCVDAFGWLSQRPLLSPAYHELLRLNPSFAYFLDEPSTATRFIDATGNTRAAQLLSMFGGALSQASPGGALTAAAPYLPTGIGGPVLAFSNPPGQVGNAVIDIGARGTIGPPTATSWTRLWALHITTAQMTAINTAGVSGIIWFATDHGNGNSLQLSMNGLGNLQIQFWQNGTRVYVQGIGTLTPDSWHLLAFVYDLPSGDATTWIDNTITQYDPGPGPQIAPTFVGGGREVIGGAYADGITYLANFGFSGDMALVSELPYSISPTQMSTLYSAFRYGGSGLGTSTSGTSYADRLRWATWNGPQAEDNYTTGQTVAYGPSSDLNAARDSTGTDALSALQAVVDTDSGAHYVARDGTVTFKARRARYNQTTPVVTFGENVSGGEIPYANIDFGYDPTRLVNDAQMTQVPTGSVVRAQDATSQALYGDVQLQRSINSTNLLEVQDAATAIVGRYKNPTQRLQALTVDLATFTNPAANGAAWLAVLGLELGSRVRVNRRPNNAPTITLDGFIESIAWTINDAGAASVDLEISPAVSLSVWQLDSATFSVLGSTTILGY